MYGLDSNLAFGPQPSPWHLEGNVGRLQELLYQGFMYGVYLLL